MERVAVVGGTGKMGRWFAKFFRDKGFQVVISGRFPEKTAKVAEDIGVGYASSNSGAVQNADIVVVATPIEVTAEVILEVANYMKKGSTLFDIASVKKGIVEALSKAQQRGIRTISVHPLFGPGARGVYGKGVAIIPVGNDPELTRLISKLFEEYGAVVGVIDDAEAHDRIIASTLALPHFLNILFGKVLSTTNLEELRKFGGTTFSLQLLIAESVFSEDPGLYSSIQIKNDHFRGLLKAFIDSAEELSRIIRDGDAERFTEVFGEVRSFLSKDPAFKDSYSLFYKALEAISVELKR